MIGPVLRATQVTSHRVLRTAERLSRGARRAAFDLAPPESPTPRLQVWSRDKARLFRYLTPQAVTRRDAPPLLLVMSLVTTSLVFDLQEHNSLVRRFLDEGYDVYLLDWGVPDEADADLGLEHYVCDEIPSALREVRRTSGEEETTLLGWCIGGTLSLLHCALEPATSVRNLVLLTTPIDTTGSLYSPGWRATPSTAIASPMSTARCRGGPSTGPTSS